VLAGGAVLTAIPYAQADEAKPHQGSGSEIRQQVQPLLDNLVATGLPGVVAHVRNDDQESTLSSGSAELGTSLPMTTDDHLRIGSITKMFTATIVLQLADERRLSLDDTVQKWLPGAVSNGADITLRQLLNHTSGLYDYLGDGQLMAPYLNNDGTFKPAGHYYTPTDLVEAAQRHAPQFPPGTDWAYSNTNYILLGMVIEKATGSSFNHELHHRIIKPLHLNDTQLREHSTAIQEPAAHGYELYNMAGGPTDVTRISPSFAWAAGGLTSTADDVAHFSKALLEGKLLSAQQLREMKKTVNDGSSGKLVYGLGLMKVQACGITLWGHGGDVPGYHSNTLVSEDGSKQITIMTNAGLDTFTAEQTAAWSAATKQAICETPQG
jgi:D-alanyl-D-alanine carboxypeptidase